MVFVLIAVVGSPLAVALYNRTFVEGPRQDLANADKMLERLDTAAKKCPEDVSDEVASARRAAEQELTRDPLASQEGARRGLGLLRDAGCQEARFILELPLDIQ